MYSDDDLLLISGIQHFSFCRRQWALICIEQQWAENLRTVQGAQLHTKAHGQRVQNSVFECIVDAAQREMLKQQLLEIVDLDVDSLRFYNLGNNHKAKIEHFGAKPSLDLEGMLMV